MEEIRVMEKPEWVSWDDVANCIRIGQATNIADGFDQSFGHISAATLSRELNEGHCWIALNNDNQVVGTLSIMVSNVGFWWYKGEAGLYCYETILPEYRRDSRVYFGLHSKIEAFIKQEGIKVVWATTHEKNKKMQEINRIKKWKIIQYTASGLGHNYYSVVMAKWMDGCPYSERKIRFMYNISKYATRFLYKPGKIFRWNPFAENKVK